MHEYDTALKLIIQDSATVILQQLFGVTVTKWLTTELPTVQTSRADLVGMTADGYLIHIELQSTNDPTMALRMAEYALRIYRFFGKFPRQIVLYVGDKPLRMSSKLVSDSVAPAFAYNYTLVDIRDLDGGKLLTSPNISDNVLAILTRLQDQMVTVRQILARIASLEEPERRSALAQFLIISGLRSLAPTVEEEAQKMPVLNDIMDHAVIGPAIRRGLQQGLQQGRQEGRCSVLKKQVERRFGSLSTAQEQCLAKLSEEELDALAIRIFDASSLADLLPEA